ncbi:MAG: aminotransferase class IV [Rhodospirillales bacterium]
MKVYLNGDLLAAEEARIDPADRGLTLGDGVFETIAVRGGKPSRLEAHLARLRDGARALGFPDPPGTGDLAAAAGSVIEANAITEGVLRLTLTRGPGPRGVSPPDPARPTLLITGASQALDPAPPATAVIAATTRRNEHSPLSRIKSLNFLDGILALREAAGKGADDALLLNGAGNLAEASAANLFLVIDGGAVTPPVADGALPGVMRADVIRDLPAVERTLGPGDLSQASEAFLTNALSVRALVAVDGAAIGDGKPGPVTEKAQGLV